MKLCITGLIRMLDYSETIIPLYAQIGGKNGYMVDMYCQHPYKGLCLLDWSHPAAVSQCIQSLIIFVISLLGKHSHL